MKSHNRKKETSEKIMTAAIDLIASRGYNGVTTEEIATKAGFTEKTLFRHFKNKQNLLESAFHHYHYAEEMRNLFNNEIRWELYADLMIISRIYHQIMYQNQKLILISSRESNNLPGFKESTHKHPQQFKDFLTEYFKEMYNKGKVINADYEKQALSFLYMNYGAAIGKICGDPILEVLSTEEFIEESVSIFVRGITP